MTKSRLYLGRMPLLGLGLGFWLGLVIFSSSAATRRKVIVDQDAFGPGGSGLRPGLRSRSKRFAAEAPVGNG